MLESHPVGPNDNEKFELWTDHMQRINNNILHLKCYQKKFHLFLKSHNMWNKKIKARMLFIYFQWTIKPENCSKNTKNIQLKDWRYQQVKLSESWTWNVDFFL